MPQNHDFAPCVSWKYNTLKLIIKSPQIDTGSKGEFVSRDKGTSLTESTEGVFHFCVQVIFHVHFIKVPVGVVRYCI